MALATLIVAAFGFLYFAFPTYTHRYRLTFEIEDNGQTKVGSNVITISYTDNKWLPLAQNRWGVSVIGPSPWVDLGDRGLVVAAVNLFPPFKQPPYPYPASQISMAAYLGAKLGSPNVTDRTVRQIQQQSGIRELKPDQYPQFIWFANPLDPATALSVQPDQFDRVIGAGIQLGRVTVEITKETPDTSLYSRLPWLKEEGSSRQGIGPYYLVGS